MVGNLILWKQFSMVLSAYSIAAPQSSVSVDPGANTPAKRVLPGYVHDLSRSRFKIGQNKAVELDTIQPRRWRGSLGAWAIDPTNNWSSDTQSPSGGPSKTAETINLFAD
jgi:hypothetical protein